MSSGIADQSSIIFQNTKIPAEAPADSNKYVSFHSKGPFSMAAATIKDGAETWFSFIGPDEQPLKGKRKTVLHRHAHYEIVFVMDGVLMQHFENGTFRYRKGDVCFLNRNVSHFEGNESDCRLVFLNIEDFFFDQLFQKCLIRPSVPQYRAGEIRQFIDECANQHGDEKEYLDFYARSEDSEGPFSRASALLEAIAGELMAQSTAYAFRIEAYLLQFFELLEDEHNYSASRIKVASDTQQFIFSRLQRILEDNHGRISREELSRCLDYNADYLNSIAKKQSGLNLTQLANRICVNEAMRLLRDTDMPIDQIVEELGYVNRTHFYRIFEKNTGMKPREYRESRKSIRSSD